MLKLLVNDKCMILEVPIAYIVTCYDLEHEI